MQARGRRGDRTVFAGEHGLIVGEILRVDRAAAGNVGRQRHVAALGQRLVKHRTVECERERDLAALAFGFYRGVELTEEAHPTLVAEPHHVADH